MAIIVHPLTVLNGAPQYTASDFRQTVNPFLFPSDGSAFNGVSGVRYGAPSPLCTISGTTVTVKPHTGIMSPWTGIGGYAYAITANTTVTIASTSASYKIAIIVNDPSQSHGTTPNGVLAVYPQSTADGSIPGLVLATVVNGVISDYAPSLQQNSVIVAPTLDRLNAITGVEGQSARVGTTNYTYSNGNWTPESSKYTKLLMDCGTATGATNSNGVIGVSYTDPSGGNRIPDALLITYGPYSNDDSARLYKPMVWQKLVGKADVRFARTDGASPWVSAGQTLSFQWLAIWKN